MEIQQILVLRGPNVWANFPVIEVWVDLRPDLDVPSNTFPGFNERLKGWLPTMVEHRCGLGIHGGFFQRLDTGTYLGHILEHTSLEIQSLVGPVVGFGRARESFVAGVYRVAIEYAEERLGLACIQMAIRMLTAARTGEPFDMTSELAQLRRLSDDVCFGPSNQAILGAAKVRQIPWIRLADNSLVQLGYGSAQRRIWTAETDDTSAVAESIAQDKELTRTMLRQAGVPVPEGRAVSSPEEACEVAEKLGFPVVVKPREGHHGDGVSIDLMDRESVLRAYEIADSVEYGRGQGVVVEQCIQGVHHRLLVVGSEVVAAAQGEPDHVVGDGKSTVQRLVELGNERPNRGDPEIYQHDRLVLDAIATGVLTRQGLTVDSIPAEGKRVILHYNGDLPNDVTHLVHPELARVAVLAAKTIGLNIAGVDFVLVDPSRPVDEQKGAVLEVNASPSLLMHVNPVRGESRPVGKAIVDQLFAPGTTGRIPIVAVSGTNGKSSVVALLEPLLASRGCLGVASSDGLSVGGRYLERENGVSQGNVERLLVNPIVDCAIVEMCERTVLEQGIGFDRCQVAVVTQLGSSDHLGMPLLDRDRMLLVERCGVDMVLPDGYAVLNADDPDVLGMVPKCPGKILLFTLDRNRPEVLSHREAGGRTVSLSQGQLRLEQGEAVLLDFALQSSLSPADARNVLAAVGAAVSVGVGVEEIAAVLRTLRLSEGDMPARAKRTRKRSHNGGILVLTLARNPSALEALFDDGGLRDFQGKRLAVVTHVPRDWRREDAFTFGTLLGANVDDVELRVDFTSAKGNVSAIPSVNGQSDFELLEALIEGARSQKRAQIKTLPSLSSEDLASLPSTLGPGSLLFVQLGNFPSLASFGPPEEVRQKTESSLGANKSRRPDGQPAEV